ncbi:nuclease SbcCD, D subunit [Syntrophobotulus glycolicus DSM 8271]|uniref:Nuclease SbcCD subunit D n=1 Tax=Syntrophobotulus glycolicus (strain DSM 8271 / FlGlyR) TaxID=645991 RepID=F0SV72_SYNGF|nr:exonuclease SbcCD subunit D [Syntrophobotulus glycolicus]ADY55572.1 nuclease SbcCD, D subunit [Syntrophobotulus glycolicus DSM 8271]
MKLLHLADLHIGKRLNEFSLLEDQKHILKEILDLTEDIRPAGILIAGDVYDKSVPAGEAVEILDDFLTELVALRAPVFLVSGNHDSPERLNFGSRILAPNGVHIAGTFEGALKQVTLRDEYGPAHIYLLPFIKPAMARPHFPDRNIESYEDAVRAVIEAAPIDSGERNLLVAHQFVTSGTTEPERSDSETIAVGGLDNIDASVFAPFDYVALGHLHAPQSIGRETVRYAGSPLKYSFSEVRGQKSATLVELAQKGTSRIETVNLTPRRDLREIKGPLAELLRAGAAGSPADTLSGGLCQDYIRAVLTDEDEVLDAIGRLRQVYPHIMRLDFENSRTKQGTEAAAAAAGDAAQKSPLDLFAEFYLRQNNREMTEEQGRIMREVLEQAGGGGQ